MSFRGIILILASVVMLQVTTVIADDGFIGDIERAKKYSSNLLLEKILNGSPRPMWINDEDRFWMKVQNKSGHKYVVVDAATTEQEDAFDHQVIAQSLASLGERTMDKNNLPIIEIRFSALYIDIKTNISYYRCHSSGADCQHAKPWTKTTEILSPTGKYAVFIDGYNVWKREVSSGEKIPLTHDGKKRRQAL